VRNVRSRLLIAGGVLLAGTIAAAAVPAARTAANGPSAIVRVDDGVARRAYRHDRDDGALVDAPGAYVDTRGPVVVDAPAAHVEVNRGSVHVEAPFVNLRIPR
jgi:hypothetical protein